MVAIKIENDGKITSGLSGYFFIMNLLATARKRKSFPRAVYSDSDWLINDGRQRGYNAGLDYISSTCQKDISVQADYFRFIRVMEIMKREGWKGYLLIAAEWKLLKREKIGDMEKLIFMDEGELKISFYHNGRLIHSLKLRVCGDIKMVESIFENNYLPVRTECQYEARYYFYLQPERKSDKFF
ncbi:DUF2913 family protein [Salmonella enterica]|nr:DUF2913 family protein [Salmonella enterica]